MRRDRFPGRPIRRPIRKLSSHRRIPPILREANRLYQAGEFEKAAFLYIDLAERAEINTMPQAANLYLRAGISFLKDANFNPAEIQLNKSLELCIENKRWQQLDRIIGVASLELEAVGQIELLDKLRAWVQDQLPEDYQKESTHAGREVTLKKVKLPAHCPNCGGPVQPNEIEWYDNENPICAFCGSILRDE